MTKILVQNNLINSGFIIKTLSLSNYITVELDDREFGEYIKNNGHDVGGMVIGEINDNTANAIKLIRIGRHSHPWLPIAIFGEMIDPLVIPVGCEIFSEDQTQEMVGFLAAPITKRVLIIEDEYEVRDLLFKLLKRLYAVDMAENGLSGLSQYAKGNYDLVILDVMLPDISGENVFKEIRNANNDQSILIITAYDTPEREADFVLSDADGYLTKPFESPTAIRRAMMNAINDRLMKVRAGENQDISQVNAWNTYRNRMSRFIED